MLGFDAISAFGVSGLVEGSYIWTRLNANQGSWSTQSPTSTTWTSETPNVGSWSEQEAQLGTIRPLED